MQGFGTVSIKFYLDVSQGTKWHRNIAENFSGLSRVRERYRRQTDEWATTYSEREHEFMFTKNLKVHMKRHKQTINVQGKTNQKGNVWVFDKKHREFVAVCHESQSFGGLTAHIGWFGLRVGGHPALSLHSSNEPGELSQWLCHDDSTINIVLAIIIIIIIITTWDSC